MGHLSLAFLGSPQVRHEGRVLTFSTRKTLALLIYLATAGDLHTRETITTLFWPTSDGRRGRAAMRRALSYLREALDGEEHLVIDGTALGFEFNSEFDLDLHTLQAAWDLARLPSPVIATKDDPRRHVLGQLQAAVDLYRGDFLAGFSLPDTSEFDDWASFQRETWHRRLDFILDRLAQLQSEGGDIEGALETSSRWVAYHPLNEGAHRRLMQLHLAAGDRAAALKAYAACRAILAEELNARPTPETEALAERIRTWDYGGAISDFGLGLEHRKSGQPVQPGQINETENRKSPGRPVRAGEIENRKWKVPLIGRATEHAQLVTAYYTARRGRSLVVTLEGEAGVGKTRLATDFLGWATGQGADVIQGKAFETGGRLPYQPLVQALRPRLERENAPDDLLSDVWLTELSRLLPELRERYPDLSLPTASQGEAAARTRMFEAVARFGLALADEAPLVVFIDDVQWADAASLDLLHYACGRWAESSSSVLLLLSLRVEDLATNVMLTNWLAGLERDLPLTQLNLEPLSAEDTLALLQQLSSGGRGPKARREPASATRQPIPKLEAFARWLFAETDGQPFYIMETLKVLVERELLTLHHDDDGVWTIDFEAGLPGETELSAWSGVPPGVREVIRARLEQLSPTSFALLVAGAVLGHRSTFERLWQVAGLAENEALPALDILLASHLLREGAKEERLFSGRPYFFSHDKIRDVVYAETSEARRRVFHRRALEVLQSQAAPAAELAHHALAAGLLDNGFRYSLDAGDEALHLFAVKVAIAHYEQARRILGEWPGDRELRRSPADAHLVRHLFVQLGRAYELSDSSQMARDIYQAMLASARELNEPEMEWTALNRLATVTAQGLNDFDTAAALLHDALTVAKRSGDNIGRAETEWNLAQISFYRFDAETSLRHGQRALTLAREVNLTELIARSLNVIAYAETITGGWEAVETHATEAWQLYAAQNNRALEADSLSLVGKARINCGRTEAGLTAVRTALTISLEIDNPWGQANCANHLGFGLLESGQYAEGLAAAQTGVTTARTVSYAPLLAFNLIVLGNIYRALLALEIARTIHLEAMAENENLPMRPFDKTIAAELCADCALAGRWEEASAYARQALAARDITMIHSGLTRWLEIEALLRGGHVVLARDEALRFGERFGNNRRYQIPYRRCLAVLAEWDRNGEHAIAHLEEANSLAEEIGLPGEQWQILAKLGELYRATDEEDQAQRVVAQAEELIRALAAKIYDEDLRKGFLAAELVRQVLENTS